jgi:hypothetical protein
MRNFLAPRFMALALTLVTAGCSGGGDTAQSVSTGPSSIPQTPSPSPAPAPGPTSSTCSPTVTGIPASVSHQGGRYQFSISLSANCQWTARPDSPWGDVAPSSGTGGATPTLTINENTGLDTRTLTVTINGQAFRTVQNIPGCSYTLDPTFLEESSGGGSARVTLTTGAQCSWTASASEEWIRVLNPSGVGSATINLDLAANPSDVRHAYLTIAGQQVNVTQRRQQ